MFLLLAESYLHSLDPYAIRFTESFGLRWYGLSYAVGFVIGWLFMRWFAKTGRSPLTPHQVGDVMFYAVVGVLVGGRLGYAIFYDPALLVGFTADLPFWDLLAINKGGMASHGGMLGVIIVCILFTRKHKVSSLHILDMGGLACTAGFFFGRLANFANAELWGRALPASMQGNPPWWSVKYPEEILQFDQTRLAALEPLRSAIAGDNSFLTRVVEAARDAADPAHNQVVELLRPLLTAYYPSQIFQCLTDGLLVAVILLLIWLKPRKPGVIGCWYLIIYGLLRILSESFRQPDEGVALLAGLSRGQVLSVLMVAAGAVALRICVTRDVKPLGGFLKPTAAG
ncbi:MAG: prolipoprotein diacylglyceryl transferase [Phycisphaerales bacterium]|nr:MAG: prolipoprotein diacylglyceryl transferase [Phycisphaerales bacterium]